MNLDLQVMDVETGLGSDQAFPIHLEMINQAINLTNSM